MTTDEEWLGDQLGPLCVAVRRGTLFEGYVVDLEVPYLDAGRDSCSTAAHVCVPAVVAQERSAAPLVFAAGYPIGEDIALPHLQRGRIVATTGWPPDPAAVSANPLSRGPTLDIALLHALRAVPMVDAGRVVIFGASAGGYMALMLAAETFPVCAVIAECPPLNLAYEVAYTTANEEILDRVPALQIAAHIINAAKHTYGADPEDPRWYLGSPVAHVDTITAPVSAFFSTADVLVPVDQLDRSLVRPPDADLAALGFVAAPDQLPGAAEVGLALVDVVAEGERTRHIVPVPDGAASWVGEVARVAMDLPRSPSTWTISVIDEGGPGIEVGHYRAAVSAYDAPAFVEVHLDAGPQGRSLTPRKLERLMDRYAGREWLAGASPLLDRPEAERADVLLGLRAFALADGHLEVLRKVYAQLPPDKQAVGPAADLDEQAWRLLLA